MLGSSFRPDVILPSSGPQIGRVLAQMDQAMTDWGWTDRDDVAKLFLVRQMIARRMGFAPDAGSLMLLRFLQGLGGAAGVVLFRAVIADRTSDAIASARLFQLMMIIGGLTPVLAPIVGTGIVAVTGWRAVFVLLAVLSTISFLGVLRGVAETLQEEHRTAGGFGPLFRAMGQVLTSRAYLGYPPGGRRHIQPGQTSIWELPETGPNGGR